jgi:hypothetical protein
MLRPGTFYIPKDFPEKLKDAKEELKKNGIIFFKEIYDEIIGVRIANYFGEIVPNIDAKKIGVTEITEEKIGGNPMNSLAFTRMSLIPHTDRSTLTHPPKYLFNWMQEPSIRGGEILLVNGQTLYKRMLKNYPKELHILEDKIALFFDGINKLSAPVFKRILDEKISIRFRDDNCVLFSDEAKAAIDVFKMLMLEEVDIQVFECGDGYLLNNHQWLHGRNAYTGHRLVCRIHLN